jgi:hypothetical protein
MRGQQALTQPFPGETSWTIVRHFGSRIDVDPTPMRYLLAIVCTVAVPAPAAPPQVSRKRVEDIFGKDGQFANPPRRDQWYYGDGPAGATFTFDNLDKVKSIECDFDLDQKLDLSPDKALVPTVRLRRPAAQLVR